MSSSTSIKAIGNDSVSKICSGQGIADIASAVKELIENSLDSGATLIEIKLKNYGYESFEVMDNGSGISKENYDKVAVKHCTSKLAAFHDLDNLTSFGFRGEALSCLCELSNHISITTKTSEDKIGTKIEFSMNGSVKSTEVVASSTGTTVSVHQLFDNLPVRRKEFHRNIKKQFAKLLVVLQSYALISTNVRISCVNYVGNKTSNVLSTQLAKQFKDNVAAVFGSKILKDLLPINLSFTLTKPEGTDTPSQQESSSSQQFMERDEYSTNDVDLKIDLKGFVSKSGCGVGRSTSDRQFWFINGRPVDLPAFTKAVNATWRTFEMKHMPQFMLNMILPPGSFDINVTPDKRTVFLTRGREMIDQLKLELNKVWEPSRYTFESIPLDKVFKPALASTEVSTTASPELKLHEEPKAVEPQSPSDVNNEPSEASTKSDKSKSKSSGTPIKLRAKQHALLSLSHSQSQSHSPGNRRHRITPNIHPDTEIQTPPRASVHRKAGDGELRLDEPKDAVAVKRRRKSKPPTKLQLVEDEAFCSGRDKDKEKETDNIDEETESMKSFLVDDEATIESESETEELILRKRKKSKLQHTGCTMKSAGLLSSFKSAIRNQKRKRELNLQQLAKQSSRNFEDASIEKPDNQQRADEVLQKVFQKSDFAAGYVIGQFNKGFILTQFNNDVFILDQHACDEKFNFERLEKNLIIKQQRLLRPFPVDLSASEKQVVLENMKLFNYNGFFFSRPSPESTSSVSTLHLIAIPHKFNTKFGAEDVKELASILRDNPPPPNFDPMRSTVGSTGSTYVIPRLPKTRSMLASKACRSSVMIGDSLKRKRMSQIVSNLAGLEHPWNCPHGRPTMRYCANLDHFKQLKSKYYQYIPVSKTNNSKSD